MTRFEFRGRLRGEPVVILAQAWPVLVFQDRVGFTMKERLQLVSLPQMGSSDSLDSERRNERPSKGRCHKPIVNRIAYARMSHSSTEVAGYTVEYVGVSMKRNGHLVEMGMYFSVIEVAAGEPCMRVRVHRDGFGGPFWDDSGSCLVVVVFCCVVEVAFANLEEMIIS